MGPLENVRGKENEISTPLLSKIKTEGRVFTRLTETDTSPQRADEAVAKTPTPSQKMLQHTAKKFTLTTYKNSLRFDDWVRAPVFYWISTIFSVRIWGRRVNSSSFTQCLATDTWSLSVPRSYIQYYIQSSCSLSNRRFIVSSKGFSPQRAIYRSRFQLSVSSLFLKVIQYVLTSSSSSSRHFFPLYFLQEHASVPTHDVSNPVSLSFFLTVRRKFFPPWHYVIPLHFSTCISTQNTHIL